MNTKAWLCDDHWKRCLTGDPCSTCPSIPENKDAVEALAKLQPEEQASLHSAVIDKLKSLDTELKNERDNCKDLKLRVSILEERAKWQTTSMQVWTGRIALIVTSMIALAALLISTWELMVK